MTLPRPSGIVTLLTDFGVADPYVGLMHGMVLRAHARAVVVDLCHGVPPQDLTVGALFWRSAQARFPIGTVHTAVVDPGVGTARRLLAAVAGDCYWLAPDNGLLPMALAGVEVQELRQIDLGRLALVPHSRTFHGRDLFAPLAGMLAGGRYGFQALGPRCADPVPAADPHAGRHVVVHQDHFGNLLTNVPAAAVAGCRCVRVGDRSIEVVGSYADVPVGAVLALVNSYDLLEIAVNQGHAAQVLGVGRGAEVAIEPGANES